MEEEVLWVLVRSVPRRLGAIIRTKVWSGAGVIGRGKREIPEITRRPTTSFGTIPTCENPETRPGIEPYTPTSGIVWHDAHVRKSGSDPAENQVRFAFVEDERSTRCATAASWDFRVISTKNTLALTKAFQQPPPPLTLLLFSPLPLHRMSTVTVTTAYHHCYHVPPLSPLPSTTTFHHYQRHCHHYNQQILPLPPPLPLPTTLPPTLLPQPPSLLAATPPPPPPPHPPSQPQPFGPEALRSKSRKILRRARGLQALSRMSHLISLAVNEDLRLRAKSSGPGRISGHGSNPQPPSCTYPVHTSLLPPLPPSPIITITTPWQLL
ncbi:hypothetical protein PR048_001037 [Dryococelus australis]|uniref:Uncharacterized protein n=1 Tax=Dryococelus australis TaxID=614101 RepID=A0ABQ9IH66_9NEOP|nr:hypothetical protein PR048_001037 [Dryococelus australis]